MENILSTPELKTRIIDLEYKHFSPKALQNTSYLQCYKMLQS